MAVVRHCATYPARALHQRGLSYRAWDDNGTHSFHLLTSYQESVPRVPFRDLTRLHPADRKGIITTNFDMSHLFPSSARMKSRGVGGGAAASDGRGASDGESWDGGGGGSFFASPPSSSEVVHSEQTRSS
ncbi:hypothetical protein MRX96_019011 [Rhipicephalus microplus]